MRRKCLLCFPLIVLALVGCLPSVETITEKPGNYFYDKDEGIKIIDIETGDHIATLLFTESELLLDEPFVLSRYTGENEEGEKIYIVLSAVLAFSRRKK